MLWGGCPLLTLPLDRFASRVAASLAAATGLGDEMVVGSQREYEDRVRLGGRLQGCGLRDRLMHSGSRRGWRAALPCAALRVLGPDTSAPSHIPRSCTPPRRCSQAVELGLDHAKRAALRRRLQAARLTCPLFDTARWVRDFERCLARMWEIHCDGGGPHDFDVGEAPADTVAPPPADEPPAAAAPAAAADAAAAAAPPAP